jgi:anaerobic magnesium-protoporphyrin IX monomethyl ester cyclase
MWGLGMKLDLVSAELEENIGLRYMAAALENEGHRVDLIPFNDAEDADEVVRLIAARAPAITGLSMVFTSRGRKFCVLAQALRQAGYAGRITAGGPFASFNCERLLADYPECDRVELGEGEAFICALADHLDAPSTVPEICCHDQAGTASLPRSQLAARRDVGNGVRPTDPAIQPLISLPIP